MEAASTGPRHLRRHGKYVRIFASKNVKGSTGSYVEIAVDHTANLLRRVFRTYLLHDRLPTSTKVAYA